MMTLKSRFLAVGAALAIAFGGLTGSTVAVAQQTTATVHGKVVNAGGFPFLNGDIKFTNDSAPPTKETKYAASAAIDNAGSYAAKDVPPGHYFAYVIAQDKTIDRLEVTLAPGDNKTLDFDMTRADFIAHMTPEEKKELEEYKKNAGAAMASNAKVANLNATIAKVRADMAAAPAANADLSSDVTDIKAAVDAKPDESILWLVYGDVLQAQGDHLARVDREAKKSVLSDDEVQKAYTDAITAYQKGIDINVASKKPSILDQAIAYNQMGNTDGKMGKVDLASAAYDNAVKLQPTKAGMYYNNEAAILFNAGQNDGALAAAEKAIAADPNRPDPYFIKGQVLIAKSTFDNKTQKLSPPPGCVDAYNKYLQLAPDGKNVASAKEILASLGEKIDTKYSAGKKK